MCPDGPGLGVDEERSLCAARMGGMGATPLTQGHGESGGKLLIGEKPLHVMYYIYWYWVIYYMCHRHICSAFLKPVSFSFSCNVSSFSWVTINDASRYDWWSGPRASSTSFRVELSHWSQEFDRTCTGHSLWTVVWSGWKAGMWSNTETLEGPQACLFFPTENHQTPPQTCLYQRKLTNLESSFFSD